MTSRIKTLLKKTVRKSRFLNLAPRLLLSLHYFSDKPIQVFDWLIHSKEDTNFTYDLTEKNILTLAQTISIVTQTSVAEITSYIKEINSDKKLRSYIESKIKQSPSSYASDENIRFGRRIGWYATVRAIKPKLVIETGVDIGLGSVVLCAALLRNQQEGYIGKYMGTDINPEAGYLLSDKYLKVGELLIGDSITSLKKISTPIDLFINDSDHSSEYEAKEYDVISKKLSAHAIIIGDNAHVTDKLLKFSIRNGRKYLFFHEEPKDHWYPGAGIGLSYR